MRNAFVGLTLVAGCCRFRGVWLCAFVFVAGSTTKRGVLAEFGWLERQPAKRYGKERRLEYCPVLGQQPTRANKALLSRILPHSK